MTNDELRTAMKKLPVVKFSLYFWDRETATEYHGEKTPSGWFVQRTKVRWNGRGNLYTAARRFAKKRSAERWIKAETDRIAQKHGGCIALVTD